MCSPTKQFYLGEEELPKMSSIGIVITDELTDGRDGSYTGPAALLADSYEYSEPQLQYYVCNECINGAITPESKNSSNASLISSNSNVKDYSTLQTIMEMSIPLKTDSPISCSPFDISINREESLCNTSLQVFIAFMIAGFGNVGAGLVLDHVQHWTVFMRITEMFVLVPSLLGLKGNLEMTMAARLSTHANLGNMRDFKTTLKLAKGNIALVQCQATVVSFLAAIVAIVWMIPRGIDFNNCLVILSSSLITANVACFALGACMVCVIVLCDKVKIDPDNIATPIAASLGDVTTAALLAAFSQLIYNKTHSADGFPFIAFSIIVVFLLLLPIWFYLASINEYTRDVVTTGWYPVIGAMVISSCGGFILDYGVVIYDRIALFQPIINGVGGNLVAVQASRISTSLHRYGKPGILFPGFQSFTSPIEAFFSNKDLNVKTSRILLLMALPAHLLYVVVVKLIEGNDKIELTYPFFVFYIFFALLQVTLLLYMAYNLVHILWLKEIDPDSYAIPLLTSSGDFLGSAFLLIVFKILDTIGDPNSIKSSNETPNHWSLSALPEYIGRHLLGRRGSLRIEEAVKIGDLMEVRILSSDEDHQVFGDDYCTGYPDQYGKWNTGFSCPTKSNEEAVYCCGTPTYKYCCTRRSQAIQTHTNHPTRTQLDPRILLKIVGLTCIVSVFLTILTCYVCKRYWKRSDTRDNHVYRVSCNTSSSPHVFPLESFQPLNPNAFFKSPEHVSNICGDISLFSAQQPTQYRVIASSRATPSALCSYQHQSQSLSRQQRNHEPPPPYQLNVISGNTTTASTVASVVGSNACGNSSNNLNQTTVLSDSNSREASNTEVKIPLTSLNNRPQQSSCVTIDKFRYNWRRMSH